MALLDIVKNTLSGGSHAESLFSDARKLGTTGNYKDALNLLTKCIEADPTSAPAMNLKAWYYAITDSNLDGAITYINAAIQFGTEKSIGNYYDTLGELYLRKRDFKSAITSFNQALNLKPPEFSEDENYSTFYRIGICYSSLQDYKTAYDFLVKAVELNPQNPSIYVSIGNACLNLAIYKKSIDFYNKAINLANNWDFNYPTKGRQDDDLVRRITLYTCHLHKGIAYAKLELDIDDILKCYDEAYSIYQDDPSAPLNIASIYATKGNKQKVREYLEYCIHVIRPKDHDNVIASLLHFSLVEYREIVLDMLKKQKKISDEVYDLYIQNMRMAQASQQPMVAPSDKPVIMIESARLTMGNEIGSLSVSGNVMGGIAAGDITHHGPESENFNSIQNIEEFVRELQRLNSDIDIAKNKGLNEDTADTIRNNVNAAIAESSKPNPDKGKLGKFFDSATDKAKKASEFVDSVKPIVKTLIDAATWAAKYI